MHVMKRTTIHMATAYNNNRSWNVLSFTLATNQRFYKTTTVLIVLAESIRGSTSIRNQQDKLQ